MRLADGASNLFRTRSAFACRWPVLETCSILQPFLQWLGNPNGKSITR